MGAFPLVGTPGESPAAAPKGRPTKATSFSPARRGLFLHSGGRGFQVVYCLRVYYVDARLVLALREILIALLGYRRLFDAFAAIGGHGGLEDLVSPALFGELGSAQIAQLVDEILHRSVVHGLRPGHPLISALGVNGAVDFELGGIAEAEIEELLITEIVETLIERVANIGSDFINTIDRRALRVVILVFIFPDLDALRAAGIANGRSCHFGSGCKPADAFLASSGEMVASILASLSLLTSESTVRAIGAQRRGLRISHSFCPFLPNSTDCPLAVSSTRVSLSESKVSRRLSRRSLRLLSRLVLTKAEDGINMRVVGQLGVSAGVIGVSSPIRISLVLPSFLPMVTSSAGWVRP